MTARTIGLAVALGCLLAAGAAAGEPGTRAASGPTSEPAQAPRESEAQQVARGAARADAVRKLAVRLGSLRVGSKRTVGDLAGERNDVAVALEAFLCGVRPIADANHASDGTCGVTLGVSLADVGRGLEHIGRRCGLGKAVRRDLLLGVGAGGGRLEASGTGRAPAGFGRTGWARADELAGEVPAGAAAVWSAHASADAARRAVRAARLDAMRRLGRRIGALAVAPETDLRAFVRGSDDPNADPVRFLKGARVRALWYCPDAPIVEADVVVDLRSVYGALRSWGKAHVRGDRTKIAWIEGLMIRTPDRVLAETGIAAATDAELREVPPAMRRVVALARKTPAWATGPLEVTRRGPDAELDARIDLAWRLRGLAGGDGATLGQLAAGDEAIGSAILLAQQLARTRREANDQGEPAVTIQLELRGLWGAVLQRARR